MTTPPYGQQHASGPPADPAAPPSFDPQPAQPGNSGSGFSPPDGYGSAPLGQHMPPPPPPGSSGMPPMAFDAAGHTTPGRPGSVMFGAVGLAAIGLLALFRVAVEAFNVVRSFGADPVPMTQVTVVPVLLALGFLLACPLVATGRDGGRLLAVALLGAVTVSGISRVITTMVYVFTGHFPAVSLEHWAFFASLLLDVLLLALALLLIAVLAGRSAGDWFHSKRAGRLR